MRTAPARRRAAATLMLAVALTGLSAGPANAALHTEIASIEAELTRLDADAEQATRDAARAAEAQLNAASRVAAAETRERELDRQVMAAAAHARVSATIAGGIAARLGRANPMGATTALLLDGRGSGDLLRGLSVSLRMGERAAAAITDAEQDQNAARTLRAEADSAVDELRAAQDTAEDAATAAEETAERARRTTASAEADAEIAYARIAARRGTTVGEERAVHDEQETASDHREFAAAQTASAATAPTVVTAPPPVHVIAETDAFHQTVTIAPPTPTAAGTAIAFARAQLGDAYRYGGSGPDVWDCSGLTKAAYAAAGVYIGTHSATNQYATLAARNQLVPLSVASPGDLLFWGSAGDYNHVAIYLGSGLIIEAANESAPVRIHTVWSASQVAPLVGRPRG